MERPRQIPASFPSAGGGVHVLVPHNAAFNSDLCESAMGENAKEDPTFFDRADSFIHLANEHCNKSIGRGKVSASLMYGTARFQAWTAACWAENGADMKAKREETMKYFVEQYTAMLKENFDDYIDHYAEYMKVGGEA